MLKQQTERFWADIVCGDDGDDGDDDDDDGYGDGDDDDGDGDGYLLAPAGQVHLDPDTLLLPPASNLKSVSESEACSQ